MSDLKPRVSIITVCLNAKDHIQSCLASVAQQTYRNAEHIVIDGGSTDGTLEAVMASAHVSDVLSEKDEGIYDAMNKGIGRASGDILIFLNADDRFVSRDTLADAINEVVSQPEGDVYYGSLEIRKADGSMDFYRPDPPEKAAEVMICRCLPHQATLTRREVFNRTGLFDTAYRFHADYDWFLKVIHDPEIRLIQIETVVGLFYEGGLSSQLERTQPEVFNIQNASPLYASPEWNRRRIAVYQQAYLAERMETARLRQDLAKRRWRPLDLFGWFLSKR